MITDDQIKHLAELRRAHGDAVTRLKELKAAFDTSPECVRLMTAVLTAGDEIAAAEDEIRQAALADFAETGNKKPHPAVGIRVNTVLEYGMSAAIYWCAEHMRIALSLNKSLFEKHARAVADTSPIPGVDILEKPTATIATDLSKWL